MAGEGSEPAARAYAGERPPCGRTRYGAFEHRVFDHHCSRVFIGV